MSKRRNKIMFFIAKTDSKRFRDRTIKPEKGKGRKNRPRKNNGWEENPGHSGFYSLLCVI